MELNRFDEAAAATHLKTGVIRPWGLAALVIGVTSPAIGLYATWGPIEAIAGPVAPLVFLAALMIILPTVLSYASLTRHAPSAGAAATWLWTTVNPTTGLVAGLVMIVYFLMSAISVPLLFALFFRDLVNWTYVEVPSMAVLAAGLVWQSESGRLDLPERGGSLRQDDDPPDVDRNRSGSRTVCDHPVGYGWSSWRSESRTL
ncbi:MAG: hypothetical protein WAN26_12335 [Steroidobacteraceae bacterium]